jgi:hypothetical protein
LLPLSPGRWRQQAPLKRRQNFYQTTRRNDPEENHLQLWGMVNLLFKGQQDILSSYVKASEAYRLALTSICECVESHSTPQHYQGY